MIHTKESIDKVLREISRNTPKMLRDNAYTEISLTPTIKMVMEKALESPDISDEKKDEIRRLEKEGYFERKKVIENPKGVKAIDNYTNREIKKAVKEGRLPTKKQLKLLELQWKNNDSSKN